MSNPNVHSLPYIIPYHSESSNINYSSNNECNICFTYINPNDQYAKIEKENGVYHIDCLKRWLDSSNNNGIMTQSKVTSYNIYFKDKEISKIILPVILPEQTAPYPDYIINVQEEQYIDNNRNHYRDLLENRCKASLCAGLIIIIIVLAVATFFYVTH